MNREHITIGQYYQYRDISRTGIVISVNEIDLLVTLEDEGGQHFEAFIHQLEYAPVYQEGEFWLSLNSTYPKERANAFLCKLLPFTLRKFSSYECIGSAELESCGVYQGKWRVDVNAPYDEMTDSGSRVLGYFDSQAEALSTLWEEREKI